MLSLFFCASSFTSCTALLICCTPADISCRLLLFTVKEIRQSSLPGQTRKWALEGLEWGGRPPPVFAVGKNRQSSSYSANSLLFRPHKKRRQRQKISDGNTSPHNQLTRRQNWQNLTEAQTSKMPQPRVASQFAIRQTGAACTICTICTEQSLQPVRPPRAFASFALAKLGAGGKKSAFRTRKSLFK